MSVAAEIRYINRFGVAAFRFQFVSFKTLEKTTSVSNLLEKGINCFNSGHYFDAHEAWEDLWRPSGGPLRLFYQGLVQGAVGMHHLSQGNLNGARAQLAKSLEKLRQYPEAFCGIDNAKLINDLETAMSELTPRIILISRRNTEGEVSS